MFLRKDQAGGGAGYVWEKDGDVVDVADNVAWELLAIPHGGFSEAEPPAPEPSPDVQPEPEPEPELAKKKGGRPRLPRDGRGNIIRETADESAETE